MVSEADMEDYRRRRETAARVEQEIRERRQIDLRIELARAVSKLHHIPEPEKREESYYDVSGEGGENYPLAGRPSIRDIERTRLDYEGSLGGGSPKNALRIGGINH